MGATLLLIGVWELPGDEAKPVSQGTVTSRHNLITAGTYIEMGSQRADPILPASRSGHQNCVKR